MKGAKNQDDSFTKAGTKSQQVEISEIVQNGAMTFLVTEYLYLLPFVIAMCIFFFIEEWIINTTVYNQDGPGGNGFKVGVPTLPPERFVHPLSVWGVPPGESPGSRWGQQSNGAPVVCR